MPLTIDDCGWLSDVITENLLGEDPDSQDYKFYKDLARRFRESYETGIIIEDDPEEIWPPEQLP